MSAPLLLTLLGRELFGKVPASELPRLTDALVAAVESDPEIKERLTRALLLEAERIGVTNEADAQ